MTKIFSKKFWILLVSITSIGGGIILACADGWGPEYGTSGFTPEAFVDTGYTPFFYSDMFYYEIGHDNSHNNRFNETNISDWYGYLENKVLRSELEYLLVSAPASVTDSIFAYTAGKIKSLRSHVQSFMLLQNKGDKKVADFITYLALAKRSEAFAVTNPEDAWNLDAKKKPAFNATGLNQLLLNEFNKATDIFLKQRYWFQLERSYFFNGSPQSAVDFYQNNESKFPKNKLYYRVLAYAAGALHKMKNYSRANYYYSKVYDGCDELKTVAHYSFHPQSEKDWKATLAMSQNNNEQATLWQMLGVFYSDEKRAIREIYNLDPKSEKLDLLLTRAVNIREQNAPMWNMLSTRSDVQPRDTAANNLLSLVTRIADAGNTRKPYMWHLAAGYLNMLNKNYNKASAYYSQAEKILPREKLPQAQLRLLKVVNRIAATPVVDNKLENDVLDDIQWLSSLNETSAPKFRYADALEWIKITFSDRYKKQKDYVKSECFVSTPAFYASDKNVEAMKSFLDKQGKSAFEQLCANFYRMKKSDLLEYQAVRLAFEDKLQDAITKMEQVKGNANRQLAGNPFNGRINDCHDCDHAASQKVKYTKLSLLGKMKEMQDKVTAGDDVYNNALLLANAYYNITHYGNARVFYEGEVIGSGHYSPFAIDSVFQDFLVDMKMAAKYYNLALNAAQTDEQKAKCQYMLAKCQRNQWYNETVYNNRNNEFKDNPKGDFKAWNSFKALKQYVNTQYYKEVIKECGYFRTYVAKAR